MDQGMAGSFVHSFIFNSNQWAALALLPLWGEMVPFGARTVRRAGVNTKIQLDFFHWAVLVF